MYLARYPALDPERCLLLPNGYDEADFEDLSSASRLGWSRLRFLHSGLIYPWERDPSSFFRALARLKTEGQISSETVSIDLQGVRLGSKIPTATSRSLESRIWFTYCPRFPIAHLCKTQPRPTVCFCCRPLAAITRFQRRAYEYLRLNKPILALDNTTAATRLGCLIRREARPSSDLDDENAICSALSEFLCRVRSRTHPLPHAGAEYSRRSQAKQLAECMTGMLKT